MFMLLIYYGKTVRAITSTEQVVLNFLRTTGPMELKETLKIGKLKI